VIYLEETRFREGWRYSVEVTDEGVIVYSECCAEVMSEETARKTRDAITAWLEGRAS
jgi:hypothetical protein